MITIDENKYLKNISHYETVTTVRKFRSLFVIFIFLTFTISPSAYAQAVTTVEIGSGTVDSTREQAPRWRRTNFDPLTSGIHTISVDWDSNADFRFSINEVSTGARVATIDSDTSPAQWTGTLDNAEDYFVGIWSAAGGVANYTATIEAETPPLTIISQPVDLNVTDGDEATFTTLASGTGELSYQWFVNDTAIVGAITNTLSLAAVSLIDNNNVYRVDIADSNSTLSSENVTLAVSLGVTPVTTRTLGQGTVDSEAVVAPRFARFNFDPLNLNPQTTALHIVTLSWHSDADVRFNVFDNNGTRLNSSVVRGSNPGVWTGELIASQRYSIRLWSTSGIANFSANLEAIIPINFDSQPSDLIVTEGDNANFSVVATGSGNLTYQWFANGNPIFGENGNSLTVFTSSLAEDGTNYTVEVSNGIDTVISDAATLTVNEPVVLGLFSKEADSSAWILDGPAPTLDFFATEESDAWGQELLRVGDLLLVGGDFDGIRPGRGAVVTARPFLAALNAVTGQAVTTFQVPIQVNSVVRALARSPSGQQVYVGGDFGLLALDATTGELDFAVSVTEGEQAGRVFDIAVTQTQIYIGGDFSSVNDKFRANIARLSLEGELDPSWSPNVTSGFESGRAAPVQSITVSPAADTVYVGGTFNQIDNTPVGTTVHGAEISMLTLNASDGAVRPERFGPFVGNNMRDLIAHDIAVTEFYVIIAWGGPNFLTFHSLDGTRLQQYRGTGDIQALQVVGDHVFVGHHGEFFGFLPNTIPPEAVVSLDPEIFVQFRLHSFRIDDPAFLPEQAWETTGRFGVWGIAAAEDSIWIAGQISRAGSNDRTVDGLARFPALD